MKMLKWLSVIASLMVTAILSFQPVSPVQAADGSSYVSFTGGRALNPIDPSLPLDYDGGRTKLPDTNGDSTKTKEDTQVVVNTTPEKKSAASTRKQLPATSQPAATRRTLPQTGSVTMSAGVALAIVLTSVMVTMIVLKPKKLMIV